MALVFENVTDAELVEAARKAIVRMCSGDRRWQMTIPAQWDDSDVCLHEVVCRWKQASTDLAQAREELDALNMLIEGLDKAMASEELIALHTKEVGGFVSTLNLTETAAQIVVRVEEAIAALTARCEAAEACAAAMRKDLEAAVHKEWFSAHVQFRSEEAMHEAMNHRMSVYGDVGTALLARVRRLERDNAEMASIIGCLEPDEDGNPSCKPQCIACRNRAALASTPAEKEE